MHSSHSSKCKQLSPASEIGVQEIPPLLQQFITALERPVPWWNTSSPLNIFMLSHYSYFRFILILYFQVPQSPTRNSYDQSGNSLPFIEAYSSLSSPQNLTNLRYPDCFEFLTSFHILRSFLQIPLIRPKTSSVSISNFSHVLKTGHAVSFDF